MKIKMISQAFTPYGVLEPGQEYDENNKLGMPEAFLCHLVNDAKAAQFLEYNTKIEHVEETAPQAVPDLKKKTARKKSRKKSLSS